MLLTRREAIAGLGGGIVTLIAQPAFGRTAFPSRNIKMIVPYPAGGTTDYLGRMVADQIKTGLKATVIVENKPGAATSLGADQVARAEPDGYTLLMATSTTLAINKTLYKNLPYDPVKDFAPIALVAAVPFALIVNPQIPAKTLSEFIAYAKANPGLAFGSAGSGSPQHLGAEMLKSAAGIDIRHVPYRVSWLAKKRNEMNVVPACVPRCVPARFRPAPCPCTRWPGRSRRVVVCALAPLARCPVALRSRRAVRAF